MRNWTDRKAWLETNVRGCVGSVVLRRTENGHFWTVARAGAIVGRQGFAPTLRSAAAAMLGAARLIGVRS